MNALSTELQAETITFKLNGADVVGYSNEIIIETAKRNGVEIPHLCYQTGLSTRTATAVRAWWKSRASARWRLPVAVSPKAGMEVTSDNERSRRTRQKMMLEIIARPICRKPAKNGYDAEGALPHGEWIEWALRKLRHRFKPRTLHALRRRSTCRRSDSHPAMAVNLDSVYPMYIVAYALAAKSK